MANTSRFTALMDKAAMHPNKLDEGEMRELASLIPDQMHSMPKESKEKWFANFANRAFLEFLMHWYEPSTQKVDTKQAVAFGELCRQGYKSGALYNLLGQIPLENYVLSALQIEIQAEIEESLRQGFFDRLFGKRPTAKIPQDPTRFSPAVSNENRLKLDNLIADALLDVICKKEKHPCSNEMQSFPELSEIRDDAKLSVLRALEVSLGMNEVLFPIAKSCRNKEEQEKNKLLEHIEKASKQRQDFFDEAKKRGITIPIDYYEESSKQLQKAKNVVEQAKAKGINVTFAYDMVALNLADEETYEAYLLAHQYLERHHELSWMKVSLSFNAGAKKNPAAIKELEEAFTLFFQRPSISHLERLNQLVANLRKVTITPMSLRQLLQESSLQSSNKEQYLQRLAACSSARDPNQVIQFTKLAQEMYSNLRQDQSNPAAKAFVEIYENGTTK